jgi:hypothetical protein
VHYFPYIINSPVSRRKDFGLSSDFKLKCGNLSLKCNFSLKYRLNRGKDLSLRSHFSLKSGLQLKCFLVETGLKAKRPKNFDWNLTTQQIAQRVLWKKFSSLEKITLAYYNTSAAAVNAVIAGLAIYQGYQMVYFQTKNRNFGKFWRSLHWKMLIYFM